MPLTSLLDAAAFHSLTLFRSGAEWQASLSETGHAWRVSIGPTPSAAVMGLFEPVPRDAAFPPLPY